MIYTAFKFFLAFIKFLHLVPSHCLSILKSVVMLIVALFINLIVISFRLY